MKNGLPKKFIDAFVEVCVAHPRCCDCPLNHFHNHNNEDLCFYVERLREEKEE